MLITFTKLLESTISKPKTYKNSTKKIEPGKYQRFLQN